MTGFIRRVVTGHDKNGKAIVVSDGLVPRVFTNPSCPPKMMSAKEADGGRASRWRAGGRLGADLGGREVVVVGSIGVLLGVPGGGEPPTSGIVVYFKAQIGPCVVAIG